MIRVVLDGLVKRFDRASVVDDVSLAIDPGELTYLLGPPGAGKTTIARMIGGLETPDEGEIYFDGRAMRRVSPAKRRVGMVFETDALWPHMTVAENVAYGLRVRGVLRRERRKRADEVLNLVRLEGLDNLQVRVLTPSHRRRLALARALAIDPLFLVIDQPTAGLELAAADELIEDLLRIHAETWCTMLVASDRPREAFMGADRVVVLDLGRARQVGAPWELYHRPADAFVARFLGPVNLIEGEYETTDAQGFVVVRTPLGRFVATAPAQSLQEGVPVTLAIRPEAITVSPGPLPRDANRFPVALEKQVLDGAMRCAHLRGPGDWPLTVVSVLAQMPDLRDAQGLTASVAPENVTVLSNQAAKGEN